MPSRRTLPPTIQAWYVFEQLEKQKTQIEKEIEEKQKLIELIQKQIKQIEKKIDLNNLKILNEKFENVITSYNDFVSQYETNYQEEKKNEMKKLLKIKNVSEQAKYIVNLVVIIYNIL